MTEDMEVRLILCNSKLHICVNVWVNSCLSLSVSHVIDSPLSAGNGSSTLASLKDRLLMDGWSD